MASSEKDRLRIRTEERTRITAKLVSSIGDLLLDDLEKTSSTKEVGSTKPKAQGNKTVPKKPQNSSSKTSSQSTASKSKPINETGKQKKQHQTQSHQRGSKSLSNLSNPPEFKHTSVYSGAKPKGKEISHGIYQQFSHNAPPSYNESFQHPNLYTNESNFRMTHGKLGYPANLGNTGIGIFGAASSSQIQSSNVFVPPSTSIPRHPIPVNFSNSYSYQANRSHPVSQTPQGFKSRSYIMGGTTTVIKNHPKKKKKSKNEENKIDVNVIVKEISECKGFFNFLKNISQKLNINSSKLQKIVTTNGHVFSTLKDSERDDTIVELCPKIKLCENHQQKGCSEIDCSKIHLCEDFIFSNCIKKDCPLGHISNVKSNHNTKILKKFYLFLLPNKTVQQLIQKSCSKVTILKICLDYNQGNCQFGNNCKNLHICISYVNNLGICSNDSCTNSHDIRDAKIALVLKSLGISTNESPRDILKILKDRHILKEKYDTIELSKSLPVSINEQELGVKKAKKKKSKAIKTTNPVCCTHFLGTVKTSKICIDNIRLNCKFPDDCSYLHCPHKSHWQFGNADKWYNFDKHHSQILDSRYSDPNCDEVDLPKPNISTLNDSQLNLVTLMGKKNLKVDFIKMTFYCESTDRTYSIRNLTTESFVLASNDSDIDVFTKFEWYFQNNDGLWELFGNSEYNSAAAEEAHVRYPTRTMNFKLNEYSYIIDFLNMTQENESTHKIRPLRRRPYLLRDDTSKVLETLTMVKDQLPKSWEDMQTENVKLVKLKDVDDEYKEISQKVTLSLPLIHINNIWRIQNILLWQVFKDKQKELEMKYSDDFLNVQKLFHSIDSELVRDIITENLQIQYQSPSVKEYYGEGIHFYNSASIASSNVPPDSAGKKTMLIADVIIGKIAEGNENLTQPPENPSNNIPYDTTTDNIQNPTVFVKYNTTEFYPSYIVDFN